ncbi:MAG: hypothetical protein ACK4RF_10010 [Cyclobacteriaceae bacterium]
MKQKVARPPFVFAGHYDFHSFASPVCLLAPQTFFCTLWSGEHIEGSIL